MTLAVGSIGQVECGVTQDKSACVLLAKITNGGGALRRVRPATGTSRGIGWIIGQHSDLARVRFVQTVYDRWYGLSSILNVYRRSSRAM